MSNKAINKRNTPKNSGNAKPAANGVSDKNGSGKKDLFGITDSFFGKHKTKFFIAGLILTCLYGVLLFDLKISEGTDDSGYIVAASNFIQGKTFPTWHGSFYPIFLSLPMLMFGVNLFALKFVSYLLMVGHFVFFYLAFKNRLAPTLSCIIALFLSFNSYILYHASSTYSEPLFFLLQALTVYFFFQIIDKLETYPRQLFAHWKLWLAFGLCAFLLSITRNVGVGVLISIVIYFVINKKFKEILFGIGSFLVFQIPFSLYKTFYWNLKDAGFKAQLSEMYYKNPYNHGLGVEDFHGFVTRFFENSVLYLSKHFDKILGLQALDSINKSAVVAIIVYLIFFVSFFMAWKKKNKYMQFIALYLAVAIGATFVTQQVMWDQVRLVLIYVPLILVLFGYGLYELSKQIRFKFLQPVLGLFLVVILFASFGQTTQKVKLNKPVLDKNIEGDKYYGFTPDWIHYFQVSEWAAKNLPEDAVIACRKPSMSFIYAHGREFFPIYKLPAASPDSVLDGLIKRNADMLVFDNRELEKNKFPANLFDSCRAHIQYLFISNAHFYTFIEPAQSQKAMLLGYFSQYHINVKTDLKALAKELKDTKEECSVQSPDQLLKMLKDNKIKYLILGSLRANPAEKTGNVIDTIHRLIYYTQLKYPSWFRQVYQIGTDDDEPAQVVEVNI